MRINHNLMAMNTNRQLGISNKAGAKSMEKLSSGFKINRAADDAAGLSISEKMRNQIRGLDRASANSQDGISLIQTAEGALDESHSILKRMRELAVQAGNAGTLQDDDLEAIKDEFTELAEEITGIASRTEFNGKKLLNGEYSGVLQIGANQTQQMDITVNLNEVKGKSELIKDKVIVTGKSEDEPKIKSALDAKNLGVNIGEKAVVTAATADDPAKVEEAALKTAAESGIILDFEGLNNDQIKLATDANLERLDAANKSVSQVRSNLGANQNRLEHTIKNLDNAAENIQASESRIRDVDMAKEMIENTKQNILQQASTAMLAQANQAPQSVLRLLG